jgi:hypothetical protein
MATPLVSQAHSPPPAIKTTRRAGETKRHCLETNQSSRASDSSNASLHVMTPVACPDAVVSQLREENHDESLKKIFLVHPFFMKSSIPACATSD